MKINSTSLDTIRNLCKVHNNNQVIVKHLSIYIDEIDNNSLLLDNIYLNVLSAKLNGENGDNGLDLSKSLTQFYKDTYDKSGFISLNIDDYSNIITNSFNSGNMDYYFEENFIKLIIIDLIDIYYSFALCNDNNQNSPFESIIKFIRNSSFATNTLRFLVNYDKLSYVERGEIEQYSHQYRNVNLIPIYSNRNFKIIGFDEYIAQNNINLFIYDILKVANYEQHGFITSLRGKYAIVPTDMNIYNKIVMYK